MDVKFRRVLLCLAGTSPAVLTETVWALALEHGWVPDEIEVLTTETGRRKLVADVLANGVWGQLCEALRQRGVAVEGLEGFGEANVFCFRHRGKFLEDLGSAEENLAAADEMLGEVRKVTEESGTEVVASIAGGRKTMGALLLSCMSLLGRAQDRVCHVLVNAPFDGGVEPGFFFPAEGAVYSGRFGEWKGRTVAAAEAMLRCFFVPYVRMRELYAEHFRRNPPSYQRLVADVEQAVMTPPVVRFDLAQGELEVNGQTLKPSATGFAVALGIWRGQVRGEELYNGIYQLHQLGDTSFDGWLYELNRSERFKRKEMSKACGDLSRTESELRKLLEERLSKTLAMALLPTRGALPKVAPQVTLLGGDKLRGRHPWLQEEV